MASMLTDTGGEVRRYDEVLGRLERGKVRDPDGLSEKPRRVGLSSRGRKNGRWGLMKKSKKKKTLWCHEVDERIRWAENRGHGGANNQQRWRDALQ